MTNIIQKAIVLNSQNKLRNADRQVREWAIAHAGAYRSQAGKELGGSLPYREWKNDNLTIRISKLATGAFKQVQLVSVKYEPAGDTEPYVAFVITYNPEEEQSNGHCISVASVPDTLTGAELPWDDKAGPVGLEQVIESISGDRSRPSVAAGDARAVATIDDLFDIHDTAIVLTEDGQREVEFQELAEEHGAWAAIVNINPAEQIAISRELPDHQLPAWVRAKIALFSRYADSNGDRLRMVETDCAQAASCMSEERDRDLNNAAGRNAIELLRVLESVSVMMLISMSIDAKDMADALVETATKLQPESEETSSSDDVTAQQRIYLLEDRLIKANDTIAELRERLAQYENYDSANPTEADANASASPDLSPEAAADSNRHTAVLDAITDPDRFSRLRFLTNFDRALADYGKPRPSGTEIVSALDAINKLAQSWYNTPGGNIGPWDNYFNHLTGWTHANGESDFTMSRYGDKRSFSDQEHRRHVTIKRHLTYRGSNGGLQIYFDKDDVTDTFIIGYIGEHLPYATNR